MQTYKFEVHRTRVRIDQGPLRPFSSSADVAQVVRQLVGPVDREVMLALHLDAKNKLRGFVEVSRGGIASAVCEPMQVFRAAVIQGSAALIFAHNHPSGDPVPSDEDRACTQRLLRGAELLGIRLLDHVIVTDDGHFSFLDSGVFSSLI